LTETAQEALQELLAKSEATPEPEPVTEGASPPEEGAPSEAPSSMSAEEKEVFEGLPQEAQDFLVRIDGSNRNYFQQRTDELARKNEAVDTERLDLASAKTKLMEQIEGSKPKPPKRSDFQKDDYFDRDAFDAAQMNFETAEEIHQEKEAEVSKFKQEMEAEEEKSLSDFQLKTAQEMQQNWPELVDPATGPRLQSDVVNFLSANLGIDLAKATEVLKTTSGMELLLVRKAMSADNATLTMQVTKKASKGIRPGSPSKPPVSEKLQKQKQVATDKLREGGQAGLDAAVKYLTRPAER